MSRPSLCSLFFVFLSPSVRPVLGGLPLHAATPTSARTDCGFDPVRLACLSSDVCSHFRHFSCSHTVFFANRPRISTRATFHYLSQRAHLSWFVRPNLSCFSVLCFSVERKKTKTTTTKKKNLAKPNQANNTPHSPPTLSPLRVDELHSRKCSFLFSLVAYNCDHGSRSTAFV